MLESAPATLLCSRCLRCVWEDVFGQQAWYIQSRTSRRKSFVDSLIVHVGRITRYFWWIFRSGWLPFLCLLVKRFNLCLSSLYILLDPLFVLKVLLQCRFLKAERTCHLRNIDIVRWSCHKGDKWSLVSVRQKESFLKRSVQQVSSSPIVNGALDPCQHNDMNQILEIIRADFASLCVRVSDSGKIHKYDAVKGISFFQIKLDKTNQRPKCELLLTCVAFGVLPIHADGFLESKSFSTCDKFGLL